MSHQNKHVICPNCGYDATENYCARCGQETHLHNETFWGLVSHFISHYFHYDSKFWQTMKALWFSPGKLTTAYWNKQRMRYIPPISLYIFISAVYFLCFYGIRSDGALHYKKPSKTALFSKIRTIVDSVDAQGNADTVEEHTDTTGFNGFMTKKTEKIQKEQGDGFLKKKIEHNIPKFFFFMIPCMAAVLRLLFLKRKDLLFSNHAIFSLHYHSFWFSIFFLSAISPFGGILNWLQVSLLAIAFVYMFLSLRNVYSISRTRAVVYSFTIAASYLLLLIIAFIIYFIIAIATA